MSDLHERLIAFAQETLFKLATNPDLAIDAIAADALDRELLTLHHENGHLQMAPELDLDYDFASPNVTSPTRVAFEIDVNETDPLQAARSAWTSLTEMVHPTATVHVPGGILYADLEEDLIYAPGAYPILLEDDDLPEHLSGPHGCHEDCPACAPALAPSC
jgi:hypothetical protein